MNPYLQNKQLEDMIKEPSAGKQIGIIRLHMVREERTLSGMERLSSPKDAVEIVRPVFAMADREMMAVMSLTTKMEPLAFEIVAVGGLNRCIVDICNLFKHSLLNNTACVMCFHNHPSGDPKPSEEDHNITRKIRDAGKILEIELIDHIIIGENQFYSFREHGEIESTISKCVI